jgi:hypothetical protein
MSLANYRTQYQTLILDGMARAFWVHAYMEWAENNATCRWCEQSIWKGDDGQWESNDGAECPGVDDPYNGHEPDEDAGPETAASGQNWNDVAPETPLAAMKAAHALGKLLVAAEGMKLPDLYELAMQIHLGDQWEGFEAPTKRIGSAIGKQQTGEQYDLGFGFDIEALAGDSGGGGGDHRRTKLGGAVVDPKIPRFSVTYDGQSLRWEEGAGDARNSVEEELTYAGRHQEPIPGERFGSIRFLNRHDEDSTDHAYLIALGHYGHVFLVHADDLGDALDHIVDWAEEHAPGLLADEQYDSEFKYAIEHGKSEAEADELAQRDLFTAGNAGHYLKNDEIAHLATDPTPQQLLEVAGFDMLKANPDWSHGGEDEAEEQAMAVRDAIDPKGPLALYKPEVFATTSARGREVVSEYLRSNRTLSKADVPTGVFLVLHPKAAAKALNAATIAEWGVPFEGQFIETHARNLLENLIQTLKHRWPLPGSVWTTMAFGWGMFQMTEDDDKTPSDSATFLIGRNYDAARQNPCGLQTRKRIRR